MRAILRIVAGSLRGRKVVCEVHPDMRPTPQMVREAFFSILGNAVPDRTFVDVFGGTGIVGLEALSRGARSTLFVERDFRLANAIDHHLRAYGVDRRARLYRTDAYRWVAAWQPPTEPVNVFLSPPFPDLSERADDLVEAVQTLQARVADESVLVLQSERGALLEEMTVFADWEARHYGRNTLLIWQKKTPVASEEGASALALNDDA